MIQSWGYKGSMNGSGSAKQEGGVITPIALDSEGENALRIIHTRQKGGNNEASLKFFIYRISLICGRIS